MVLSKTKWVTLTIAIFFAILQVLQPFIHAHLDTNHPAQETGFHMGADHEESFSVTNTHSVSVVPHASHIVSVTSAIKQDIDPALLTDAIALIVICLCFSIALQSALKLYPQLTLVSPKALKQRLPAARAPPL
ncbi:hypothetical protein MCEMEM6_00476 [Methylophilaceae bacterium]